MVLLERPGLQVRLATWGFEEFLGHPEVSVRPARMEPLGRAA